MPLDQAETGKSFSHDSARMIDVNDYVTIERNPISRSGVFQYLGSSIGGDAEPNRIYNVFRPPQSLMDPRALESFKLMPIIDDHRMLGPREKGLTPPEEYGTHGTTGESVFYDDTTGILFANLRIYSMALLDEIQDGKTDLSMGYRCDYKKSAGMFQGMPYDYIQVNMKGNHLALVDEARCNVAVLDSRFTYDSRDVITKGDSIMADENKGGEGEGKGKLELADVHKYMKENAPMWAELKTLMADDDDGEGTEISPSGDVTTDEAEKKAAEEKAAADAKAKDEAEKAEKEGKGMDAKAVQKLVTDGVEAALKAQPKAPTFADFAAEAAARDSLVAKLTPVIGTFDAKDKTLAQVAAYGVEKLGLKNVPKGSETVALDSFLAGCKPSTIGLAFDSKRGKVAGEQSKAVSKIAGYGKKSA